MKQDLLKTLRDGGELQTRQQLQLIVSLSIPAVMAQISSVIMEYVDASMVGRLGADASAAIGLVSSTTWLLGGICGAASMGFRVLAAQKIGAKRDEEARSVMRHGLLAVLIFNCLMTGLSLLISSPLPGWLGGGSAIRADASRYFFVYSFMCLVMGMDVAVGGMLQSSGNMRVPSILNILKCFLNVAFNALLIFPSTKVFGVALPGAGLGVTGAALGTVFSELCCLLPMLWFLLVRSPSLHLRRGEHSPVNKQEMLKAVRISLPVAAESVVMGGAYVVSTKIVAPLGNIALAANSFAVTAEGLCYMPGYGISAAATTLIGQSIGAGRRELTRRLGLITTHFGIAVMTVSGLLMYIFAPQMMGFLTPDPAIRDLGVHVLRIEAFAEPMFAASIVATGVFRGTGDTFVPTLMNLFSMWAVRLPLAALLAGPMGLTGVWIAMAIELCVRGGLLEARLVRRFCREKKPAEK